MREAGRRPDAKSGELGEAAASPERILATQNRILRLIATGETFDQVLASLVEAVESHVAGARGSVMLIDRDADGLRHGSAPSLSASLRQALDSIGLGPAAGTAGTAAYRGEPVGAREIAADPLWEGQRPLAAEHDLAAAWSQPVLSGDRKVLGTITLYFSEPRLPSKSERSLVEQIARLAALAIERHRHESTRRASERRLLRQKSVLVELAKSDALASSDFPALCRLATQVAAETLEVERVSIWLYNEARTVLGCECLYEMSLDRHSSGVQLESSKFPRYFAALERGRSVVAHDAHRDPDTSEFSETYLAPLGIGSMLDAPIRRAGRLVGVVCHEHVGPSRSWATDEQDFAESLGDFVSLALEASERRAAQQAFRSAQEELLRQDFQARKQIEFEMERMKDELVRQTRLATIGQVAASIAHELRNPLGAIRNATWYLRRRVPADQPKWAEYLEIIEQEVQRSDLTINDLLEMSQAKPPAVEPVDLEALVRDAFEYARDGERVELRCDLDPRPFIIDADPGQLRQVLTNLMLNAVQSTTGAGHLTVRARRIEGFNEIVVSDSGPGVPEALRERIFEPLVTTRATGTGLGLPICRQIVERHGGKIALAPPPPHGAAFRILLPHGAEGP